LKLAVVLITRNQAWNVGRLVESVLGEIAGIPSSEVLLVDSASTDGTADLAARYPIDVVRLDDDQPLTPAAGRYVGFNRTQGELVLFVDGDMALCPGWLEAAIEIMRDRPNIAGLTGRLMERSLDSPAEPMDRCADPQEWTEVRHSAGLVLHRRTALEEVGPFNPWLRSEEEPELCIRLRKAGYKIGRPALPAAFHFTPSSKVISILFARRRRGLYLGAGQAIRHNLRTDALWTYVRERGWGLAPGVGLAIGAAASLVSSRTGHRLVFRAWLLTVALGLAADVSRKRSPYRTLFSIVQRLILLEGTIRGFLMKPSPASAYPGRLKVVRAAPGR
jgi:glycosyltransferase involved in cell wall biosynthesis